MARLSLGQPDHSGEGSLSSTNFVNNPGYVNPKVVSEMLGHASIAITLDTYSHVLPTMQESAAKAMEDALS